MGLGPSLPHIWASPSAPPNKAIGVWNSVEERYRKRLASRKMQYISKGGKLTLIRSTLSRLSIFYLSLFHMPKMVCTRLEMIQRQFLWGGDNLEKKPHLVKWATVYTKKKNEV